MRTAVVVLLLTCGLILAPSHARSSASDDVKETTIGGPDGLAIKVRMEGPYTADAPLQVVSCFRYATESAKRMSGAPIELDKRLGGVIASLRERGEFVGDELESVLIIPKERSIKANALLLIGLADEAALSVATMERVGKVALREATRLGVRKAGFAPLIRDQGNSSVPAGEIAQAVARGVILARDTEIRLAKEGLGQGRTLEEWVMEAGPKYLDETVDGVRRSIDSAATVIAARPKAPYLNDKK